MKQIAEAVEAFVNAQSLDECESILNIHRDELLTGDAETIFTSLLTLYKDDRSKTRILQDRLALLARYRSETFNALASVDGPHPDRLVTLRELKRLGHPGDAPRRVEVCRTALTMVDRNTEPELWALLQGVLADSLIQSPVGDRGERIDQAIACYLDIIAIYARESSSKQWSRAQYGAGRSYLDRIHGERADNIERAIEHFDAVLGVCTHEATPELWISTHHSLGRAYLERSLGQRADSIERAIEHFHAVFSVCTREVFAEQWASIQNNLGEAYRNRIRGKRAENIERAIDCYQRALEVWTPKDLPEHWAAVQNNVANAYTQRIHGERADNIEQAIVHYQLALGVRCRSTLPAQWAETQNNLATAYLHRIYGRRSENLEYSIALYQDALEICTRELFPERWADIQVNLANVYEERICGERAENLEQAIKQCHLALEIYTRELFPEQWAAAQNSLATAYLHRIHGEQAYNIEQSLSHYEMALGVYTPKDFPVDWAMIQNNLGLAFLNRVRGEEAENLEQAIKHCQHALEIWTLEAFPDHWAAVKNNLGEVYRNRIHGERSDNLKQSIEQYQQAMSVYARETFPMNWAMLQGNLGTAYLDCVYGEHADNIERAIDHFQRALEVWTRESFPERWALIQSHLGEAYSYRVYGTWQANVQEAIRHYRHALEIYTPESFPQACRNAAYHLGRLLYDVSRLAEARHALSTAHQAVEALRGMVQREAARRQLSEENADIYTRLVYCCLIEGDDESAFEYAVAGKGRAFIDMLASARFDVHAAGVDNPELAADLQQARELQQQIDNLLTYLTGEDNLSLSRGLTGESHLSPDLLRAQLEALQDQSRNHWEDMSYKYPTLTATQVIPTLSVNEACALATDLEVELVEYYCHAEGWCAFVVTPDAVQCVPLPGVNDDLLRQMKKWANRIESHTGRGSLSYKPLSVWHDAIITPLRRHLSQGKAIVLAPFGPLHLLPFAAARDPITERYITQDYTLAFAPSLGALRVVLEQDKVNTGGKNREKARRLLSVAYPGVKESEHYLPNVLSEAQAIARQFSCVTSLYLEEATPNAVVANAHGQDVIHLGCHGWFDIEKPDQSGLMLAGGWLTVQRIITELHLDQTRLVTMAACLSGHAAMRRGEEHVGLLQSMMTAGAQAVVASLWNVDDAATRAFFHRFYAEVAAGHPPAVASRKAIRFVQEQPHWTHPYYWAAFQVSGLAHGPDGTELSNHLADLPAHAESMDQRDLFNIPRPAGQAPIPGKRGRWRHPSFLRRYDKGSTRGGNPMNEEQIVQNAETLLEQMTEYPNDTLAVLDPAGRKMIVQTLGKLSERAGVVQDEDDLLSVADAIQRLVEDTSALRALLLPEETDIATEQEQRTVTQAHHKAAAEKAERAKHIQTRAAQIRNRLVECNQKLEQALRELVDKERKL